MQGKGEGQSRYGERKVDFIWLGILGVNMFPFLKDYKGAAGLHGRVVLSVEWGWGSTNGPGGSTKGGSVMLFQGSSRLKLF